MAFLAVKFNRRLALFLAVTLLLVLLLEEGLRAMGRHVAEAALAGRVVVIDPGHGGVDPGSVGKGGILEKDVVLDISLQLKALLERAGARVVMTRSTDTDVSGYDDPWHPNRYKRDLHRRVEIVEAAGADALLSIHANADRDPSASGAQVFYKPDPSGQNRRLAETIQTELKAIIEGARPYTSNDIHQLILNRAKIPAATVEVGFLSNPREAERLSSPEYRRRLAWAIFIGLARFFAEGDRMAGIGSNLL